MPFPEYEELERPLLCYIHQNGGSKFEVQASSTYIPLADHFRLSTSERLQLRGDGRDEALWNNMVQWARRKLKDNGYLESAPRGVWRLSAAGIKAAERLCNPRR